MAFTLTAHKLLRGVRWWRPFTFVSDAPNHIEPAKLGDCVSFAALPTVVTVEENAEPLILKKNGFGFWQKTGDDRSNFSILQRNATCAHRSVSCAADGRWCLSNDRYFGEERVRQFSTTDGGSQLADSPLEAVPDAKVNLEPAIVHDGGRKSADGKRPAEERAPGDQEQTDQNAPPTESIQFKEFLNQGQDDPVDTLVHEKVCGTPHPEDEELERTLAELVRPKLPISMPSSVCFVIRHIHVPFVVHI
jgi:hypothetical protein